MRNPARKAVDKELGKARARLNNLKQTYGDASLDYVEGRTPTMREFKAADKKIYLEIQEAAERVAELAAQQKSLPPRVPLAEARPDQDLVKLSTERKHLTNVLKLVAYQIESDLVNLIRPHYARAEDEGRTLIRPSCSQPPPSNRRIRNCASPYLPSALPTDPRQWRHCARTSTQRRPVFRVRIFACDSQSRAIRSDRNRTSFDRGMSGVLKLYSVYLQYEYPKRARNSLSEDFALFPFGSISGILLLPMFLRSTDRKKNDRIHRYFSVVENRRLPNARTVQRTVLYLGEINDQQQAAWRKSLEVFDEDAQDYRTMSLFPDDREVPADALDSIQVKLSGLELRRPRTFGACWLGCELWQQLGLDEFWQQRLPEAREAVSWEKVLQLQVVNCLLDPGSDYRLHRQWYVDTAMDELLETDFAVAAKDRLYRCLDRILPYKQELFIWLKQKWADLFHSDFEVLLYDLTSTYFEGEMEQNPKAKRGYSRDKRPDCLQLETVVRVEAYGILLTFADVRVRI